MNLQQFLSTYSKEVFAVVSTFVLWILNNFFRPRARLIQGIRHASNMVIAEPVLDANGKPAKDEDGKPRTVTKLVRFAQVSFVNAGREPATDLQVTFNWKPQHLNVWPQRHYSEQTAPSDRFTLQLGTLPPKEFIAIDLLAVENQLPDITSAHCKECAARMIPLQPQEVHPRWKLLLVLYLMVIGFAASLYLLAAVIQWIAAR